MSILHLSAATVYGGGEEHVRTLLGALQASREEGELVALACPVGAPLAEKVRACGVDVHGLAFGGKTDPGAPLRLRTLVKRLGATHVHSHNRREDLANILGTPPGVIRLTTLHDRVNMCTDGSRSGTFFDRIYLRLLRRFDRVLAVSIATLEDYARLTLDDRRTNLAITNGMDLSRLEDVKAQNLRQDCGVAAGALIVAMSARVRGGDFGKKGHLRLIAALSQMKHPVHLVTVGEDEASGRKLREMAAARHVPVSPLGFCEIVLPVLAAADVVVLPSLYEGLPRSLMEAMALGRAVVGSDVDGIRALTGDGEAGLLLPPNDETAWATTLDGLALDPARRGALGVAAQRRIKEHFSSGQMAADHWRVYRA